MRISGKFLAVTAKARDRLFQHRWFGDDDCGNDDGELRTDGYDQSDQLVGVGWQHRHVHRGHDRTSGTGTRSIAATYSGDGNFAGATSSVAALVVGADATPAPTPDRWALLMLVGLLGATAFVRLCRL